MPKGKGQVLLYAMGIPQCRIADEIGCDPAYVYRCLAGKQKPSERLIEAARKVTGLKEQDLFEGVKNA